MKDLIPFFEFEEIIPLLTKISIFGGLNPTQLYKIFKILNKGDYKDGEYIFKQGSKPTHIYIILKGKVKMVEEINSNFYQLFEFEEGKCIGEDSIIGIYPHTLSALAVGEVELIVIPRKALLNFYETDKDLFSLLVLNIAREISRRLKMTDNLLLHYIDDPSQSK
ncbi:hypothetical protein PM10SUCC1_34680 [Propionigenium maris DSM 9537]|uniref:Cyclic nucleotide-binding domain-containing protein n=1 Tax=Propionigenium maris DSM 9537 TaxID=1123000 RepID=A0A9W6GMT2_9FUSO|nr:Crp/Fnr family transcriptional regulator [Propionigenium maris]GLI57954.1 hypothetical protein PM10SUCC1_34680 [Propionigenium maris DSM 9537]